MNLYQQKYLKYKNKYELLKKQIGGDCPPLAARRIGKDLQKLYNSPRWGISAVLDELNVCKVHGTIAGPRGTPYEGYLWRVVMNFPSEFPFKAPTVNFVDRIFHPNIHYDSGSVCISILKTEGPDHWNPSLTAGTVLQSIQSMLSDPNPNSPLNGYLKLYNIYKFTYFLYECLSISSFKCVLYFLNPFTFAT